MILGQSGSDAVSAALKTALLHYHGQTRRHRVWRARYHGLGYGAPLAACGLRRELPRAVSRRSWNPARDVLVPTIRTRSEQRGEAALAVGRSSALATGDGRRDPDRAGARARRRSWHPPSGFFAELARLRRREHGALLIADEIWTGLGPRGRVALGASPTGARPDLICLGKGLGGGLLLSARGRTAQRDGGVAARSEEVVETSTFAGAPLACATASLATPTTRSAREKLPESVSARLGAGVARRAFGGAQRGSATWPCAARA